MKRGIGIVLWIIGISCFVIFSLIFLGMEATPLVRLGSIIGLTIPTLVFPYQYWQVFGQYEKTSSAELLEKLKNTPLKQMDTVSTLIFKLGKRGNEVSEAAPYIIETFKKCLKIENMQISHYASLTSSFVNALTAMGKGKEIVPVLLELIENPPFKDSVYREHFIWLWIGSLGGLGVEAEEAIPQLKKFIEEPKPISKRVKKAAIKALEKIQPTNSQD